jgi:hypothetical protein
MADEHNPNSLASSGAVVAAIAAIGLFYFHREAPLTDLRPTADQSIATSAAPQNVEARLWQDGARLDSNALSAGAVMPDAAAQVDH